MARYFISAGWPYMYDIPGLHNCVPMLFADVYARFFRLMGDEVFYLCGGDEHGSRIEFVAKGYRKQPQELINEKYDTTMPLLKKMGISIDKFGRTSDPQHKEFVRNFISKLIEFKKTKQRKEQIPYCTTCLKYLPDRFVEGKCPHCGDMTYGGQCNNKKTCGKIIETVSDGNCALCGGSFEYKNREHIFFPVSQYQKDIIPNIQSDEINFNAVKRKVEETFEEVPGVSLTRDTNWGILFPNCPPDQTIYSWVDSLLGKVSFLSFEGGEKEKEYWKDSSTQRLFFLGMDGVPFYGVLFPAMLLASQNGYSISNWTLLPNEIFIYEGGVCSKSTGTGIWLTEALSVLEADLWRFYIFYNYAKAEKDVDFRWEKFTEAINRCLINGLEKNLNRVLTESEEAAVDFTRIEKIKNLLSRYETAKAFEELLSIITDFNVQKGILHKAMQLFSCYLPDASKRAVQKLEGNLPGHAKIFNCDILNHQEIKMRYQELLEQRRSKQALHEEITDLRADSLCVCPINLTEQ